MQNLWNDIDVRVVHPRKGYELQEQHIQSVMQKHQIPFAFELRGDKEDLSPEIMRRYFTPQIGFSKGSLSCTLKHLLIYDAFLQSSKRFLLVFEDDIFLAADFTTQLKVMLEEIEQRHLHTFLISLENSCMRFPSYWQTKQGQTLYLARDGRAAGAYLIDQAAAKAMLEELRQNKCGTVIDWWHNYLVSKKLIKLYWAHPTIAEQGSHNGKLSAAISTHHRSKQRQIIWQLHKFIRTYIKRLFNESRILPS